MESTLYLMKNVDLDPNYNYTIDFDTIEAQNAYFDSKISEALDVNEGYSQIKFDEPIKVYQNIDELFGVNYLRFENHNKTYYAFIVNKKWVSDTCTALEFKLDVYQSFMFDFEIDETFIEREHQDRYERNTSESVPLALYEKYNIQPENIELGKNYKQIDKRVFSRSIVWVQYLCTQSVSKATTSHPASSSDPATWNNFQYPLYLNGVPTELYSYIYPYEYDSSTKKLTAMSNVYAVSGECKEVFLAKPDFFENNSACIAKRILPYLPFDFSVYEHEGRKRISFEGGYEINTQEQYHGRHTIELSYTRNNEFGGVDLNYFGGNILTMSYISGEVDVGIIDNSNYIVKEEDTPNINNLKNIKFETKLKTYPYSMNYITNNQTNPLLVEQQYRHKYFATSIKMAVDYSAFYKTKLYLMGGLGDKGDMNNIIDNSINELPLKTSAYLDYMASNKTSATTGVAVNLGAGVATMVLGIATGGVGFAVAGAQAIALGAQIANQVTKIQDLKNTPDNLRQSGNNAFLNVVNNELFYYYASYEIEDEFKQRAFNYFYRFGYKCNNFKKPNVRSRYYFNYIKTLGANIKSNIDNTYKTQLMEIFDRGITIWHYRDNTTFKGVNNYDYENVEMNLIGGTNG